MSKQLESILGKATRATPEEPKEEKRKLEVVEPKAEPQKSIQAYVPESVARAVNIKAAEEEVTVRTILLQGLNAIGIQVPEHEMRDRRK